MALYILRIVNLPAQLMRSEEKVAPATKLQNLATAIGGVRSPWVRAARNPQPRLVEPRPM